MTTSPKPFAFVLMPFSEQFDDIYELAIQPACDLAGAYAERVDKQIFHGSILDRVYNQISKADIIIADMSERNPNVFYEVGYAHALGKPTILLTKTTEDIPFDLRNYPHIVYNSRLADLKKGLESRVRWHIEHPSRNDATKDNIVVRVNGIQLTESSLVLADISGSVVGFELKVDFLNKIDRVVSLAQFQIGLFTPLEFTRAQAKNGFANTEIEIDATRRLYLNQEQFAVLPEAWDSITFVPCTDNRRIEIEEEHIFTVRVYREFGYQDHTFKVKMIARSGDA